MINDGDVVQIENRTMRFGDYSKWEIALIQDNNYYFDDREGFVFTVHFASRHRDAYRVQKLEAINITEE